LKANLNKKNKGEKNFKSPSDIEIKSVYSEKDSIKAADKRIGGPGSYPYTRGIYDNMYRGRLWTMRQYAGFGTAEETNKRYHFLLSHGTTGLSVAFDLPTQMGHDSDDLIAKGEVGKVGVAISSIQDMRDLLKGIPLEKVSISMTINSTAAILLSMLLIVAKEQGVSWKKLQGTVQNDILKEYIARGTYIYPPRHALRLVTDVFSFCHKNVPKWNTISISGYHMREAGSNAVQELAFTFSNAITYVTAALKAGLKIDEFAPRLAFFFNCHNDFFEEIAKFRAARRMWARIVKVRFKAKNSESFKLRFHTQTAGSSLTAQQPLNNIVRTSIQAMAAVLGGTQSLHTNSFDEALGLPTEKSARVALRTQQIIANESGAADTVDPVGGSYFIEHLTDTLENEAFKLIKKIDNAGGMLSAIEKEIPQTEIERSAYEYQKSIESHERIIVGVNDYAEESEILPEAQILNPKIEKQRVSKLKKIKKNRDVGKFQKAMANLEKACNSKDNLMPLIIKSLQAGATLGEISDLFRQNFGTYE
jgi:methylmalonyl-CoA mutase N-terminal domain/subunit